MFKMDLDKFKTENIKLKKDIDWLANSAKNSKMQADRAIGDLEAYTQILRSMENKLNEVEAQKLSQERELEELKIRFSKTLTIQ